jgi:hypothetical protein
MGGGGLNRMQVEVSKYTEGTKENAIRPNGLPESRIRYDGNSSGQSSHFVRKHVHVCLVTYPYEDTHI